MTQGDLLAEAALQQVEANADSAWLTAARRVLWDVIKAGEPFVTDVVWERLDALDVHTHEPRALGALLRKAARAGYIRTTGEYRKTMRPEAHSRPVPVWEPIRKSAAA